MDAPLYGTGRDQVAVAALRSVLSALANAEAVQEPTGTGWNLAIEQSAVGVGAADAERKILTRAQSEAIARAEITERREAAIQLEQAGQEERAQRLLA